MQEEWRDIPGWTGYYQVSSTGKVRSLDRRCLVINRFGNEEWRLHRGVVLSSTPGPNGYVLVSFTRPGGERSCRTVHSLVAECWFGPCPSGLEVCHMDGARANNAIGNLRYGTRSSNALDRHRHGTMNPAHGEQHYFRKLTDADVRWIRTREGTLSHRAMAEVLGVTHGTVGLVLRGVSWKHVA